MSQIKRIWKFLSSMRFAIMLLLVLAAACAGGSFITQGKTWEWYASAYGERMASLVFSLGLDDVFHSWWFIGITLFLCLNLLLCNVVRLPALLKRWRERPDAAKLLRTNIAAAGWVAGEKEAEAVFAQMGFAGKAIQPEGGGSLRYRQKNRIGLWGAWLCHLGVLILIAGFALGQMTRKVYTVYGVPGTSHQVGESDLIVTIDDFEVKLRDDDTVEQYRADLTVHSAADGSASSGSVSVNHPLTLYGMKFYQNSTGWAATATVLKDGEQIQQEVICAGEYLEVKDKEGLSILFAAFYPDFYRGPDGSLTSLSSAPRQPGYLYRAYYQGNVIGMNVLTGDDVITIDEYTVIFSDPQNYTLLQIKRDRFTPVALFGGLLIALALLLSFYMQPREIWAWQEIDGTWQVRGRSRKGGTLFDERLRETIKKNGGSIHDEHTVSAD